MIYSFCIMYVRMVHILASAAKDNLAVYMYGEQRTRSPVLKAVLLLLLYSCTRKFDVQSETVLNILSLCC